MNNTETKSLRLSMSTSGPGADVHVVRVDGIVDTVTSPELDSVLASLVAQGKRRIIIDLAGTSYISSAGWGTFIARLREIRDGGGDLHLARMTADVREIYDLLEFEGVLPHHDRLENAQAAFNGGNGKSHGTTERPLPVTAPPQTASPIPTRPEPAITHTALGATAFEAAVLQLIVEDPFYTIRELCTRLSELGHGSPGWWTVWQTLRHRSLLSRRSRFRYFRRHQSGFSRSIM